jgi:hypothetical protein
VAVATRPPDNIVDGMKILQGTRTGDVRIYGLAKRRVNWHLQCGVKNNCVASVLARSKIKHVVLIVRDCTTYLANGRVVGIADLIAFAFDSNYLLNATELL